MASRKHCGACKLRWGRRAHIFDLTRQCQPSYHIILPPRCRVALGRAGHITLESLLRDPSPLEPSRELTLLACSSSPLSCNPAHRSSPEHIAPKHQNASFSPKRSNYCIIPRWTLTSCKCAKVYGLCLFYPQPASAAAVSGVAFLQFRFYALFTFLPVLPKITGPSYELV